ncbi:MAG: hypothetical protein RLZZ337_371 [Bacteroidota bacterium]|jgi:hypothetical protein
MPKLQKTAFLFLLFIGSSYSLHSQTPVPQAAYGIYLNQATVKLENILKYNSIEMVCPPCDSALHYSVTSFRLITVPTQGSFAVFNVVGKEIPADAYRIISNLKGGDIIIVEAITAQLVKEDQILLSELSMSPIIITLQ